MSCQVKLLCLLEGLASELLTSCSRWTRDETEWRYSPTSKRWSARSWVL